MAPKTEMGSAAGRVILNFLSLSPVMRAPARLYFHSNRCARNKNGAFFRMCISYRSTVVGLDSFCRKPPKRWPHLPTPSVSFYCSLGGCKTWVLKKGMIHKKQLLHRFHQHEIAAVVHDPPLTRHASPAGHHLANTREKGNRDGHCLE